jgi:hypothetical protein
VSRYSHFADTKGCPLFGRYRGQSAHNEFMSTRPNPPAPQLNARALERLRPLPICEINKHYSSVREKLTPALLRRAFFEPRRFASGLGYPARNSGYAPIACGPAIDQTTGVYYDWRAGDADPPPTQAARLLFLLHRWRLAHRHTRSFTGGPCQIMRHAVLTELLAPAAPVLTKSAAH